MDTIKDKLFATADNAIREVVLDGGARVVGGDHTGRTECTLHVIEGNRTRYFKMRISEMI